MKHRELSPQQEQLIENFRFDLAMIDGPDDMFPDDGYIDDKEPLVPVPPTDDTSASVALAAVYDLTAYRNRKEIVWRHE